MSDPAPETDRPGDPAAAIARLCAAVDAATMMRHLEEFSRRVKLSGSPEELESFGYLQATLDSYGYRTSLIRHEAYISLPGRARIEVGEGSPDCITHSFSRSSTPGGTRGQVVYVGFGTPQDFAAVDVRGRVALLEAIANPAASLRASQAGAIGQIHISPHQHLHEMCISPVWGNPTPDTLDRLPRTVVLSVRKADGDALKRRVLDGEAVVATLHAEVDTAWRDTPLLVAELGESSERDEAPFVMFSGHHDTWHLGVMDNGGANATMLEVARLLAPERAAWRRGLRLCFWSGHSQGRYSGSTWYADNHWDELARRCVVHVNVDSTGARGNTVMSDALASAELTGLAAEAVREQGSQELTGLRMTRAGDQSFWGIGVPSLFMGMGEQPAGSGTNVMGAVLGGSKRKAAGLGWWWHTPDDTLDKMDGDQLVLDTRVYVHAIWRLLTDRVLPLDYVASATALAHEVSSLAQQLVGRMGLSRLTGKVAAFGSAASAAQLHVAGEATVERLNRALVAVGRAMVPMDYTSGDRFDHDPALAQAAYPVLDPLRRLAASPAGSDEAMFLSVAATRACNRLGFALDQAAAALASAVSAPLP